MGYEAHKIGSKVLFNLTSHGITTPLQKVANTLFSLVLGVDEVSTQTILPKCITQPDRLYDALLVGLI